VRGSALQIRDSNSKAERIVKKFASTRRWRCDMLTKAFAHNNFAIGEGIVERTRSCAADSHFGLRSPPAQRLGEFMDFQLFAAGAPARQVQQ